MNENTKKQHIGSKQLDNGILDEGPQPENFSPLVFENQGTQNIWKKKSYGDDSWERPKNFNKLFFFTIKLSMQNYFKNIEKIKTPKKRNQVQFLFPALCQKCRS